MGQLVAEHFIKTGINSDLSARERNRAKRKAKLLAKQTSRDAELKNAGNG